MLHFPRQTSSAVANSSSAAATPTPSESASSSTDAAGSRTSILTSAADSTSVQLSSSASATSSSTSADPTTSSSSTVTTSSASSSPSTSPSSSALSTTTSDAATSPSTSQTTSSASSSVPSSTTTQPPTPSSSQQTTTTITSAYTTFINGSQILTSTSFPSTIPELSSSSSSSNRTAVIAGSAAGGTAFILLILTLAFCIRRKRFRRVRFLDAITLRKKQARSRATLLDGEVLADVGQPPRDYIDYDMPWDGTNHALMTGRRTLDTPAPTLPSRWADTGSAFREEVWPPPNEATQLMDPLTDRGNISVDLSRIVDDVMGPSHARTHFTDQSISSMHRGSVADSQGTHSRTTSNASHAALLEAAGLSGPASTAPVRPSPLAQVGTTPASTEGHGGYAR